MKNIYTKNTKLQWVHQTEQHADNEIKLLMLLFLVVLGLHHEDEYASC